SMTDVIKEGKVIGKRPSLLKLTDGGKAAWQRFTRAHAAEVNSPDFPDFLAGPWSKLRAYCGRLALVLHLLRRAAGDQVDKYYVDEVSLKRAAALVNYFKGHPKKVYATLDSDLRLEPARIVLGWILRENRAEFKRWEVHRDLRSQSRFPAPDSLDG